MLPITTALPFIKAEKTASSYLLAKTPDPDTATVEPDEAVAAMTSFLAGRAKGEWPEGIVCAGGAPLMALTGGDPGDIDIWYDERVSYDTLAKTFGYDGVGAMAKAAGESEADIFELDARSSAFDIETEGLKKLQFIFCPDGIDAMVVCFDIPCCRVTYRPGEGFRGTFEALWAIQRRENTVDLGRYSASSTWRLIKYMDRGYDVKYGVDRERLGALTRPGLGAVILAEKMLKVGIPLEMVRAFLYQECRLPAAGSDGACGTWAGAYTDEEWVAGVYPEHAAKRARRGSE